MKRKTTLIALTLIAALISAPQAFPAGKTAIVIKKAGRSSTSIPNTILSGNGVPSKSIGIDGDFYIDIKNANLYGPKTKSIWKIATSLRIVDTRELAVPAAGSDGAKGNTGDQGLTGAAGSNGTDGAVGATGAKGADGAKGATGLTGATGSTGATGYTGATGAIGAIGATGAKGADGTNGAPGAKGDTGLTGLTGAAGADGAAGAKGDTGLTGLTGAAGTDGAPGAAGVAGAKGDVGATGAAGSNGTPGTNGSNGAAGISNAFWVALPTMHLSSTGVRQTTNYATFGTTSESGSYTFQIVVDGTFSATSTKEMAIGVEVAAGGVATNFSSQVISSDSYSLVNGSGSRHFQFLVFGTITSDATGALLKIRATDLIGDTGSNLMTLDGYALITKVGSIG